MQKWLFVDEEPEVAEACKRLLALPDEFEVVPTAPEVDVTFLRDAIARETPDGILLDHALNDARPDISYAGSTLAAFIRSEFAHLPIVVLSAKLNDQAELRRYRRTEDLFDLRLDKQKLQLSSSEAREQLVALGHGYKRLSEALSSMENGQAAHALLGIDEELEDGTDQAALARLLVDIGAGEPSRVAHFLLQVALRLPGPIVDSKRAAVGAGLAPNQGDALLSFIEPAAYTGVFSGVHPGGRYWRELLSDLTGDRTGLDLARCVACDGEASDICEVCEKPVDGLHSLPVRRNEVANDIFLRGRVCGYCLAGDLPTGLTLDERYAEMRKALVAEVLSENEE